jgi:hypothetical protein
MVSAKILPLYFAVACSVCVSAQDSPLDRNLNDRCVSWVRSVTPNKRVDPVDFCSGLIRDNVNGWSSISSCGMQPPAGASKPAPKYCASSGLTMLNETWAAGFSSVTSDGGDLLFGADPHQEGAVFYSRTAVWIGNLRIPAGMYSLSPSKSLTVWTLAPTEQGEATAERPNAEQTLYTIPMRSEFTTTDFRNPWRAKNLAVLIQPFSDRCPRPSKDFSVRELHFFFRDTDLFVCIRPDQAAGGVLSANRKLPVRPR